MDNALLNDNTLRSCKFLQKSSSIVDSPVVFFDLDNTLYGQSTGIAEEMGRRIELYFQQYLRLPADESAALGRKYYLDYGLAIKGIIRHFQIDASHYDTFVDGGLELEMVLHADDELHKMLDRMNARKWIFTNAGLPHAMRVLRLLGIVEHFEGIVYCDYCEPDFPAKPDRLAYERAMLCAGIDDPSLCYFVDDNAGNVRTATELGWNAIHFDEKPDTTQLKALKQPQTPMRISRLIELETILPELFK
jgi:pyrimidine and pyridine-specific 5'-nucleotidase